MEQQRQTNVLTQVLEEHSKPDRKIECLLCETMYKLEVGKNFPTLCTACTREFSKVKEPYFNGEKGQEYAIASEAIYITAKLMPKYHPHLMSRDIRLDCIYVKNAGKHRDKVRAGYARKVSGLSSWLSDPEGDTNPKPFFLMEISWEIWEQMNAAQRVALVDHEMEHFGVTVTGELYMKSHDVEEFSSIVYRHGLWSQDVKMFVETAKEHLPLFDGPLTEEFGEI